MPPTDKVSEPFGDDLDTTIKALREIAAKPEDKFSHRYFAGHAAALLEQRAATSAASPSNHAGHVPDLERVRLAHSFAPSSMFKETEGGHRVYSQASGEACYLCVLLAEIDRLKSAASSALPQERRVLGDVLKERFAAEQTGLWKFAQHVAAITSGKVHGLATAVCMGLTWDEAHDYCREIGASEQSEFLSASSAKLSTVDTAELMQDRRDAERYRWLRDVKPWPPGLWERLNLSEPRYWDAEIDRQMAATEGRGA